MLRKSASDSSLYVALQNEVGERPAGRLRAREPEQAGAQEARLVHLGYFEGQRMRHQE